MFYLDTEARADVREIMARAEANNFCLFVFDSRRTSRAVKFIVNYGMSEEVRRHYSSRLWAYDPFLLALPRDAERVEPKMLERRQLENNGRTSRPYWQYIDRVGYRDIVASIHPFTPDIFLVGGLMDQRASARRNTALHGEATLASLDRLVGVTANHLVSHGLNLSLPDESMCEATEGLSRRERDVVAALQAGKSNKQIAAMLMLSEFTVQNHFKRLFKKFAVSNRTALLARLQSMGLL